MHHTASKQHTKPVCELLDKIRGSLFAVHWPIQDRATLKRASTVR